MMDPEFQKKKRMEVFRAFYRVDESRFSKDGKTAYVGAYYDIDSRGDADLFKVDISKLNLVE